jgi:hypothetical protein
MIRGKGLEVMNNKSRLILNQQQCWMTVQCWNGEEMKEKVGVSRELDRAIIYNK